MENHGLEPPEEIIKTEKERTAQNKAMRIIGITRVVLVGGIIVYALYPLIGILFLSILERLGRGNQEALGWFGVGVVVTTFWGALWLATIGIISYAVEYFTRSKIPTPIWFEKFTRVALVIYVILVVVFIIIPALRKFDLIF